MTDEEAILEEAADNLKEAGQRIRATRTRLRAAGMDDHPNYRDLTHRVLSALAATEAAHVEAKRRLGRGSNQ